MSTQGFQLDPSLTGLPLDLLKKRYDQMTPDERRAAGFTRPATDAEAAAADQPSGAPADFGGPVLPNPNGVKVSDDTDSGIPVTRLPDGVTLQKQNFTGPTMPADASNPPAAALLGSTVGANYTDAPKTSDSVPVFSPDGTLGDIPSDRLPHALQAGAKPGVNIIAPDGSKGVVPADRYVDAVKAGAKVAPFEDQEIKHPGFWASLGEDLKTMVPSLSANANDQSWQRGRVAAAEHQRLQDNANQAAADEWRKQHGYSGAYRAAAPVAEGLGVNVPGMEKSAQEGDVGGVAGHAAAVPVAMAATEGVVRGVPGAVDLGKAAAAGETGQKLAASAKVLGASAEELPVVGKFIKAGKKLGALNDIWNPEKAAAAEPTAEPADRIEDYEGQTSPQTEHAAATESEPGAAETPESLKETLTKKGSPADLEKSLNDALGGRPLEKGVPLKNQNAVAATAAGKLPEGFTPTDSSALKGYKYNPTSQQFEAITTGGQHYVHGDVTPEQFAKFEAADSKGAAWNELRKAPGVVGIAKGPAGNPQPITRSAVSATPEGESTPLSEKLGNLKDFINQPTAKAIPKAAVKPAAAAPAAAAATPSGDLTSLLQQSLDQAPGKGGVFTSAVPKTLLDRWGVDPESFAEGREQTRGMSPQDSAASIKKLTAAYKKGQAVEPVLETRDANNNIIDVDGRGRALAAHKAGIERIPIIVRRMGIR